MNDDDTNGLPSVHQGMQNGPEQGSNQATDHREGELLQAMPHKLGMDQRSANEPKPYIGRSKDGGMYSTMVRPNGS